MKVLVTGAAGFIGAHVARALLAQGHAVVGLDSFTEYYDTKLKKDRVHALIPDVPMVRADVADRGAIEKVFTEHTFDRVCHLAAQAGVRYSLVDPWSYTRSNVEGTQNVLEYAHRAGNVPVVYASSSSVYGDTTPVPFSEDAPCTDPVSLYAATKRSSELVARVYTHLYALPTTGLRFFTVYGPWGRPDMAPILFTKAAFGGEPIDVFNSGNLRRDFTYVDDIVDGVVRALKAPSGCRIYNLGRGAPVVLGDFITEIERASGYPLKKIEKPMQPGDVHETYADITKARQELGYMPQVSLREGIEEFVKWYRSYYNKEHDN